MENKPLLYALNYLKWWQEITIELMAFVFLTSLYISRALETNMLLDKASDIDNLLNQSASESDIEITLTKINTWKLTISVTLSIIVTLYAGPLSDKYSMYRIVFLYVPIGGQIVCDISNCVNTYNWKWPPEVAAFFHCIIVGSTGSTMCFTMLSVTYLSHLSSESERTTKIGHLYAIQSISAGIGTAIAGCIVTYSGYLRGFFLCCLLNLVAIALGIKFIKKIPEVVQNEGKSLFDINHVLGCVEVIKKNRTGRKQLIIGLSIAIYPLIVGFPSGESSVMYLYVRNRFHWKAMDYSIYVLYQSAITLVGTIFCTEFLCNRLKLQDTIVGISGSVLDLVCSILKAIVAASWEIYAVSLIGVFNNALTAVLLSLATKCVESHEYGKLNAVFGLTECFVPMVYPIYNQVYKATIDTIPSSFFIINVSVLIPIIILFSVMHLINRNMDPCSEQETDLPRKLQKDYVNK